MKTIVPVKKTILTLSLFVLATTFGLFSQAQTQLIFTNAILESGSAGTDGAVYRFPSVTTNTDALVVIKGRSHSAVKLTSIDQSSTGYANAFQPEVVYNNGFSLSAVTFWIDFKITFVNANTSTPVAIPNFNLSALDMDGDNNKLYEWTEFYSPNPTSYTVESNSLLNVSNITDGKRFNGITPLHVSGVDTTATNLMTTLTYNNVSSLNFRAGATTTTASFMTTRNYSIWFKNFNYVQAQSTLPVHLISFQGNMNKSNKVTLNWTVADNEIANNFEIERSFNGRDFTTVGVVFASEKMGTENYMYYETTSGTDKVMYRLKMIDKNHEVDYSRILIFQLRSTITNNIKIIGNPVNDKLTFSYTSPATQIVDVKVYDMSGRVVVSNKVNSLEGSNVISLPLSSTFKAGMYVVEVNNGTELQSSKFVKQ